MNKYSHGGDIYSARIDYDFSANINPQGLPEGVKAALLLAVDSFSAYPDCECRELSIAVGNYEKIPPEKIFFSNGAAELIYRIAAAVKPEKALLLSPSFSEYEKALFMVGCEIKRYFLFPDNGFVLDENILGELTEDTDIFFLCNPNNPTGSLVHSELLKKIVIKCAELKIILVIDECFMDFVSDSEKFSAKVLLDENVVILKAFTKIFAMAGLRLGYIISKNASLLENIKGCGQPWSVSSPAQLAGIAAVSETAYLKKTAETIDNERGFLFSELKRLGIKVYPSVTNFLLFRSEIPVFEKLLKQRIAIRSCSNFEGLGDGYYRIAVRLHEENLILINALERIINNG